MERTGADVDAMLQTVDEARRADMITLDALAVERMRADVTIPKLSAVDPQALTDLIDEALATLS